jgi:hypothetical protein
VITIKDHKQGLLFDPWAFLGPKRRQRLDESWAGLFRQHILDALPVAEVADHFHSYMGRPSKEIHTVLAVMLLQQAFDLTEQECIDQLAYSIQWHYALNLPEESDQHKYICPKTLWRFHQILLRENLHAILFERTTARLAEIFQVSTEFQRLDSVHIRSNMARLGRIRIFVRVINKFLVNLHRHHRALWQGLPAQILERYGDSKALGCFSLIKPSQSAATLQQLAQDLYRLHTCFADQDKITAMASYKLMGRVIGEQCQICPEGAITLKACKQVCGDSLQNPSDPDATYSGHKGQGYQVQLMETYSPKQDPEKPKALQLITHVALERACDHDVHALIPALKSTKERDLAPAALTADSLYGAEQNLQQAAAMGVELISPVMGGTPEGKLSLGDFELSDKGQVLRCPQGHAPEVVKCKKSHHVAGFGLALCAACPQAGVCPAKTGRKRRYLRYEDKAARVAMRRREQLTDSFRQKYRFRAGIEGSISQLDRLTGVKHLRVRGWLAVGQAVFLKVTGLNLLRAAAARRARRRSGGGSNGALGLVSVLLLALKEHLLITLRAVESLLLHPVPDHPNRSAIAA